MESAKQLTCLTPQGRLALFKQIDKYQHVGHFNVYETKQNDAIYLVLDHSQDPSFTEATQRIQDCYNCLNQGFDITPSSPFRKYDGEYQCSLTTKTNSVLLYKAIDANSSINRLPGKLTEPEIMGLAVFCLGLVCKLKQAGAYLGSFFPNRIYRTPNKEFIMVGGQFFTPKCTSEQFMNKNQSISPAQFVRKWKYQPPELYDGQGNLSYLSDLFVVGCILYELITGEYPFASQKELVGEAVAKRGSFSEFANEICKKMLNTKPTSRTQPEEIMHLLQLEIGKSIFNTCKLSFKPEKLELQPKPGFFNNFQQFIIKCTTETEGWFLYYCENCPAKPDQKYLDQILAKISKKNEKIHKLASLIQKCAAKSIKQQVFQENGEDNTCTVLKMGTLIFSLLRRLTLGTIEPFYSCFSKVCGKVVGKKSENKLIPVIFKIVAFKVSLSMKFPELSGNFHITVSKYERLTTQSWQYLCQYCLKVLGYMTKFSEEEHLENLQEYEISAINIICEEVYDGISSLLFCVMAAKKDRVLKICHRAETSEDGLRKIDSLCAQIVNLIGKLCASQHIFSCQKIYSINSNYYEYQEELCLMYRPITTSYEYFYLDRNQYKGLSLPKNYAQDKDCDQLLSQVFRQPISSRLESSSSPTGEDSLNSQCKSTEANISGKTSGKGQGLQVGDQTQQELKGKVKEEKQKQIDKQVWQFQEFLTGVCRKEENNSTNPTFNSSLNTNANIGTKPNNKDREGSVGIQQVWFEPSQHNIYSYEWLKKTEKLISKHFEKPELDPVIYVLYEDICRGLKLQELIEVLGKNKKMIVDPSQVLFQKVIGSGSAGEVYIGKYKQRIVAIKKVKISLNPNALKEFEREVLTYLKIKSHANLVSLVGLTKYNQDYFLLTQFCEGGSLFDLLHKKVGQISLSWRERIAIALDIAKGMAALHFMNPPVIHRDLKSLNVFMVNRENRWSAKVADFGLSRSPDADMMTSALGTLHWMAPELLCNKQYSLKVDVYSFAVVLWEICSRRTPYHNIGSQMGIVKHVVLERGRPLMDLINEGCPKQLVELMRRCWSEEAEHRPYFPEIVVELKKLVS